MASCRSVPPSQSRMRGTCQRIIGYAGWRAHRRCLQKSCPVQHEGAPAELGSREQTASAACCQQRGICNTRWKVQHYPGNPILRASTNTVCMCCFTHSTWHEYINGNASDSLEILVAQSLQHNYYNLSHMPVESWEVDVSDSAWPPASQALEREIETWPAVQHRSHQSMMPPEVVPAGLELVVLCCSAVKRLWCLGGHLVHAMLLS